jgi:type 1 fimbria pilin
VLDTRNAAGPLGGPAIQPAGTADRSFNVAASSCGIPADAKSISVNVTATNVTASGAVSIYRGDSARTGTNTGVLLVGKTRANNAILQLALDGSGTVKVQNTSAGTFDLILDVNGYFR